MPAQSPQISKVSARNAIERLPEVRSGAIDLSASVAGYCNDSASSSYGKVWAVLRGTGGDVVQYSGYGDSMHRARSPSSDMSAIVAQKIEEGFQDIDSKTLGMQPWSSLEDAPYRGVCALKKRMACKTSDSCVYRKGSYTKSGKRTRKSSCTKRSRSGKKMRRSKANMLGKIACAAADDATWVSGKKGSHTGYCRAVKKSKRSARKSRSGKKMRKLSRHSPKKSGKKSKRSARTSRSGKKMHRLSRCNTFMSGKRRSRKSCKKSATTCSWRKGSANKKGYCARKR